MTRTHGKITISRTRDPNSRYNKLSFHAKIIHGRHGNGRRFLAEEKNGSPNQGLTMILPHKERRQTQTGNTIELPQCALRLHSMICAIHRHIAWKSSKN